MNNPADINVNLNEAEDLQCSECDSVYFEQVFRVKKISALLSPSGKEMMAPIPLLCCINCKTVMNRTT
tara:strand:- start:58 stop:261 length:204 start_codon:yes stop_codon:yes gene_type:complete